MILFGETEFFFDEVWQDGLPQEDYLGHTLKDIYVGAIISSQHIHLLVRGLKDKERSKQIKELICSNYSY